MKWIETRAYCVYCKKPTVFFLGGNFQSFTLQVMPHKETSFGSSMYEETSFGTPAEATLTAFWGRLEFFAYKM